MKIRRVEVPLQDGVAIVERLSVSQMISLLDRLHVRRRDNLVADLDAASVESSDRLSALAVLDKERGLLSCLFRHAFTVEGSIEIIRAGLGGKVSFEPERCNPGDDLESHLVDDPQLLVDAALSLVGVDDLGKESSDPPVGNAEGGSRKKSSDRSGSKTRP